MNGDSSVCNGCGLSEPDVRFHLRTVNGTKYKAHLCTNCKREYKRKYPSPKEKIQQWNRENGERRKAERAAGLKTARFILCDSRRLDKRKGRDNDLDHDFIQAMISRECNYCGDSSVRMTLDRIDNSKGHLKNNVTPACVRCNYLRRDMPFEAWKEFIPTLKRVRELGFFGTWSAGIKKVYPCGTVLTGNAAIFKQS